MAVPVVPLLLYLYDCCFIDEEEGALFGTPVCSWRLAALSVTSAVAPGCSRAL